MAIAISLANKPALLLADEPTGEVDSATAESIFNVFQDLNQQYGLTIIIVSHDAAIARQVNRVVAIRDGKTSSETVRTLPGETKTPDGLEIQENLSPTGDQEMTFEEVTLLDAAGRLQVPHNYLEKFAIKDRVYLELTDRGILILPAKNIGTEKSTTQIASEMAGVDPIVSRWRAWVNRLRGKGSS